MDDKGRTAAFWPSGIDRPAAFYCQKQKMQSYLFFIGQRQSVQQYGNSAYKKFRVCLTAHPFVFSWQ